MSDYECAVCNETIEDKPYWCHPLMATNAHDEDLGLHARAMLTAMTQIDIAAKALPFHKTCLEKRIGLSLSK